MGVNSKTKIKTFNLVNRLLLFLLFQFIILPAQISHAEFNESSAAGEPSHNTLRDQQTGQSSSPQTADSNTATPNRAELKQNFEKTARELQRVRQAMANLEQENQNLKTELEKRPQPDIKGAEALKESMNAAQKELTGLREKVSVLENENRGIKNNERIRWFITGACVFFVAWLIGFAFGRMKRKRPSLL